MKIQSKRGLLQHHETDPRRVDFEKQAFASCHHPFIINLHYAFQTESCAIFVLDLATGSRYLNLLNELLLIELAGDLNEACAKCSEGYLSEERVVFYTAECVLALTYMHQLGLMYRDLKV